MMGGLSASFSVTGIDNVTEFSVTEFSTGFVLLLVSEISSDLDSASFGNKIYF